MKKVLLTKIMRTVVLELEDRGRYGTSHVYNSTTNSVSNFLGSRQLCLHELTPAVLKDYECWLRLRGLSWDTVGTYMHTLQAVYNRAVDRGLARFVPHLFKDVFTGRASKRRHALEAGQVRRLLVKDAPGTLPASVERAAELMELQFRFQGMPFVDLAHLLKSDYSDGHLTLRRVKTGCSVTTMVDSRAAELLARHAPADPSSPYLLDILPCHLSGRKEYIAYQSHLRMFNARLKELARLRRVPTSVTSYSMRYTWATQSKFGGVPVSVISEGLGHNSVKTTEVYLKRFGESVLDKANKLTISRVLEGNCKRWVSD